MQFCVFVSAALSAGVAALPTLSDAAPETPSSLFRELPTIELPYGSYRASKYDMEADLYVFKTIRFAAPPIGDLRFAKPAPPEPFTGIADNRNSIACPQMTPKKIINSMIGADAGTIINGASESMAASHATEDCLFLDVYVPSKALHGEVRLPVLNWIHGGAYILGSKDGLYDGTPLVKASNGSLIYVAANYRVGSLGFLAGESMEKEKSATANSGLHDQRAALEWIQKFIYMFGGDPKDVTAMGESAGGGSIMHHLTAYGGKQEPLFNKAIIQSPAYTIDVWDRKVQMENVFKRFEKELGCEGQGIECLRKTQLSEIMTAQSKLMTDSPNGGFIFTPAPDGEYVRQLPQLEMLTGKFTTQVESLIISHVTNEASIFSVFPANTTEESLIAAINLEFNKNEDIVNAIVNHMPFTKYSSQLERVNQYIQHSVFTCNTRFLSQAYKGKTYNAVYHGTHGADLRANFFSGKLGSHLTDLVFTMMTGQSVPRPQQGKFQKYLVSMALSGDPNTFKDPAAPTWPKAVLSPSMSDVLIVNKTFEIGTDLYNTADDCDLWANALGAATNIGGYAPPDAVFNSNIGTKPADPSKNYQLHAQ